MGEGWKRAERQSGAADGRLIAYLSPPLRRSEQIFIATGRTRRLPIHIGVQQQGCLNGLVDDKHLRHLRIMKECIAMLSLRASAEVKGSAANSVWSPLPRPTVLQD
jgi:hypothetical protein